MRFSLRLNNDVPAAQMAEVVTRAEALGFDQVWVSDDLMLRSAPVLVTLMAERTERIRVGAGVLNARSIHVSEIAMMAATLQEISGGRFLLGIGAGAEEFLAWVGLERAAPLAHTRRTLLELRALGEGRVPDGWHRAAHLGFEALPAPVYVGAMGPRMLALAGELADGALPLLFPPERWPLVRGQVESGATGVGRSLDEIDLAACVWCSLDEDPDRARRALAEKLAYYGASFAPGLLHDAGIDPDSLRPMQDLVNRGEVDRAVEQVTSELLGLGIAGGVDDVLRRCVWLADHGARHLSFGPPLGPDLLPAVELLGREVVPAFG